MTPFDDLSLLRAFIAIVDGGSISGGAQALNKPQPTMSRYLRTLEERCGATLIQRDTHRMRLTEAGQRFYADALAMLELADEAEQRLWEDRVALQGHLRICSTIEFGQTAVPRLLAAFLQDHPRLTAELDYSNRPLNMIEEGFDAGILAGHLQDDLVVARPAGEIVRYPVAAPALIASRSQPHQPADLADWPWMSLAGAQFGGSDQLVLEAEGREPAEVPLPPVLVARGVTSLREVAYTGLAGCVLPHWLVEEDIAAGRLTRLLPEWHAPSFPVHVVYPAHRRLPARARAFVDFAVQWLRDELA
ncbi:MAG: LysR family transcriptional regulator [Verrucomicrobiota bacterium JB022]|nr:LysR family transcriptional regulator [Verrucomicrobiota bacterium JB022]